MPSISYYVLVYAWMTEQISNFQENLMGRATNLVVAVAFVLLTVWVMVTGYKIITGQIRTPLMGIVGDMAKIVLIVSIAAGWSGGSSYIENLLSTDLPNEIMELLSGSDTSIAQTIDANLTYTQLAMTAIDAVQVAPGDVEGADAKSHAADLANFGTASPPMVAGAMYLMYKWLMAFFIGLGPIFLMCLIFPQTKHLFDKWLYHGITTMFSMATLAVMTTITLKLTLLSAAAFFTGDILSKILPVSSEGLTTQAMEQGGVGLLMTLLLLTVPRTIGNYFGGAMGEFMAYSTFGRNGMQGSPSQQQGGYTPPNNIAQTYHGQQGGSGGFGNVSPGSDHRLTTPSMGASYPDANKVRTPPPGSGPVIDPRALGHALPDREG